MFTALCLATAMFQGAAAAQDEAMFARTYKQGEKISYVVAEADQGSTMSVDLDFAVKKLVPGGRATVTFTLSNLKITPAGGAAPSASGSIDATTDAHNFPAKFKVGQDAVNIISLFEMVAASTLDKKVKAGDTDKWTWNGEDVALTVGVKVTAVDTAGKRLKAEIDAHATHNGKDPIDLTFDSVYDLANGSLVESNCKMSSPQSAGASMTMTIKRKP
ncbi:MAG TPA: hypothetical protein VMI31_05545 [Fimbriimonadaceae bacterium]|nr:hypothetical protein [Fimbriimonadaceae bacterium]